MRQTACKFSRRSRNLVSMLYDSISPRELAEKLENGEEINLIDVREPVEFEIARIEGARLLPLSRFQEWIGKLEPVGETIVMCHHGVRSGQVCAYLAQNGFEKIFNLEGGIDSWSLDVDEKVPRY
jgi:rhodanese-related sulfurtransferase